MNRSPISDKKLTSVKKVRIASEINKCGRCKGTVYHAPLVAYQQIKTIGKLWHLHCFVCANEKCKIPLDSRTFEDVAEHEGEAYCKTCYANNQLNQNCLKCKLCGKRRDSSIMKTYETEVYCTACYNKYYSPLGKR